MHFFLAAHGALSNGRIFEILMFGEVVTAGLAAVVIVGHLISPSRNPVYARSLQSPFILVSAQTFIASDGTMEIVSIFTVIRDALEHRSYPVFTVPKRLEAPSAVPDFALRPLTQDDEDAWQQLHMANEYWLGPWESTDPMHGPGVSFADWIRDQRRSERDGLAMVFGMELHGRLIGQISLGAISYGSMRSGTAGYWIDQGHAGRGLTPLAVCMLADWAMFCDSGPLLHRIEIDIVPTNHRSRSVARKVGAVHEGIRRQYMYIQGEWKDHESYSLLSTDAPSGFVARYLGDTQRTMSHTLA